MSRVRAAGESARTLTLPRPTVPPFGVYQQAIPEWQLYAFDSLSNAERTARAYLRNEPHKERHANRFSVNEGFATTYVERGAMRAREDRAQLRFDRVLERIGNLAANSDVISVPINRLTWRRNTIVAAFDRDSVEYKHLLDQQVEIIRILGEAGMSEPPVNRPHHTSLGRYQIGTLPHEAKLHGDQRFTLLEMVNTQLTIAGIDSVKLGQTIVGNNYFDPFILEDWLLAMDMRTEAYEELLVG